MIKLGITGVLIITLMGCAAQKIKELWTEEVKAIEGYLIAPPTLDDKKGYSQISDFKPCEKVKFIGVFKSSAMKIYSAEIQQGDKKFIIDKFGGNYIMTKNHMSGVSDNPTQEVIGGFKKYVSPKLPIKNRKVKVNGKQSWAKDLICKDKMIFTSMTKEEFIFIQGYPEDINRTVSSSSTREQYVYQKPGGNEFQKNYYYFVNNKLTSWQD